MSVLDIGRPRAWSGAVAPRVNASHPLAAGLTAYWSALWPHSSIAGPPFTPPDPAVSVAGEGFACGRTLGPDATADRTWGSWDCDAVWPNLNGGTITTIYSRSGALINSHSFGVRGTYNAQSEVGSNLNWSDGNIYWDFGFSNDVSAAGHVFSDAGEVFCFSSGSTTQSEIWCNGALLATRAWVAARTLTGGDAFHIENGHANTTHTSSTGARVALVAIHNRDLSTAEKQMMMSDPYCMLEH